MINIIGESALRLPPVNQDNIKIDSKNQGLSRSRDNQANLNKSFMDLYKTSIITTNKDYCQGTHPFSLKNGSQKK